MYLRIQFARDKAEPVIWTDLLPLLSSQARLKCSLFVPTCVFVCACMTQGLKRVIERWWWNNLKSRETVESMLSLVYAHKPSVSGDPSVAERIIEATEHPAALDAFVRCAGGHA